MRNLDTEFSANEWRDYQYGFDIHVRKALLERWAPLFSGKGASLEMGSFDGSMTNLILEYLPNLEVIEGSGELARTVRERFNGRLTVHHSWFEEFSPDRAFENIFLVHGLEHVERPVEVLRRAASWLSDGGKLFVAVPNANALSRQIAVRMGLVPHLHSVTEGEALHGHLRTYSLDQLRHHAIEANLKIVSEGGVILKALSNAQFDSCAEAGIVNKDYISACDELSLVWPEFSASIYVIVSR